MSAPRHKFLILPFPALTTHDQNDCILVMLAIQPPHHDVKVQYQRFLRSKTSSNDNHILSHGSPEFLRFVWLAELALTDLTVCMQTNIKLSMKVNKATHQDVRQLIYHFLKNSKTKYHG